MQYQTSPIHGSNNHIFAKIPGGVRTPGPPPPPLDPRMQSLLQMSWLTLCLYISLNLIPSVAQHSLLILSFSYRDLASLLVSKSCNTKYIYWKSKHSHFQYMYLPVTRRQILDSSKLKEFAADNLKFDKNGCKLSKRVENIVGKGEIARYKAILLFPHVFSKGLFPRGVRRCHCVGMG